MMEGILLECTVVQISVGGDESTSVGELLGRSVVDPVERKGEFVGINCLNC